VIAAISTWTVVADKIRRQGAGGALWSYEANGLVTTLAYDYSGHLISRIVKDGSTVVFKREVMEMDLMGNPTEVDGATASISEEYSYDGDRHFLTTATAPHNASGGAMPYEDFTYSYTDGALGLRDEAYNDHGSSYSYRVKHEYVAGTSRVDYVIEEAFNSSGVHNPEWDWKNVYSYAGNGAVSGLTMYQRPSGQTTGWEAAGSYEFQLDDEGRHTQFLATSAYDHRWLRTRRVFENKPLDFWHDQSGRLATEVGCEGSGDCTFCTSPGDGGSSGCVLTRPMQEYIWLDGAPIALVESDLSYTGAKDDTNAKVKNIHVGLLSEPRRVTNSAKTVVWSREFSPFDDQAGTESILQSTSTDPTYLAMGFPGQYLDPEQLYYNWHRFYNPRTGAYWEADPLVADGLHGIPREFGDRAWPYSYANARPTGTIDPFGLKPTSTFVFCPGMCEPTIITHDDEAGLCECDVLKLASTGVAKGGKAAKCIADEMKRHRCDQPPRPPPPPSLVNPKPAKPDAERVACE